MNLRQKITLAVTDVAILCELVFAMYAASLDPENFTPAFCKAFFSLFVPTLVAGIVTIRVLRTKKSDDENAEPQSA